MNNKINVIKRICQKKLYITMLHKTVLTVPGNSKLNSIWIGMDVSIDYVHHFCDHSLNHMIKLLCDLLKILLTEFVELIFVFSISAFHILIVFVIWHLVAVELKLIMQFFISRLWKRSKLNSFHICIILLFWDLQRNRPHKCWWRFNCDKLLQF